MKPEFIERLRVIALSTPSKNKIHTRSVLLLRHAIKTDKDKLAIDKMEVDLGFSDYSLKPLTLDTETIVPIFRNLLLKLKELKP